MLTRSPTDRSQRPSVRRPDGTLAQALFTVGTIVLVFAFAATIGHAVMLANGRRAPRRRPAGAARPRCRPSEPAWAGVATGSFVDAQARGAAAGPTDFAAPRRCRAPRAG